MGYLTQRQNKNKHFPVFLLLSAFIMHAPVSADINTSAFYPLESVAITETFSGVSVADIDSDGDKDLFVVETGDFAQAKPGGLVWLENAAGDASSWVRHEIDFSLGLSVGQVLPSDVDNDGRMDAVGVRNFEIVWWKNTDGGVTWELHVAGQSSLDPTRITLADLNGDNFSDLVLGTSPSLVAQNQPAVWLENPGGAPGEWAEHTIDAQYADQYHPYGYTGSEDILVNGHINVADITGDGALDLIVPTSSLPFVVVLENADGTGLSWYLHSYMEFAVTGAVAVNLDDDAIIEALSYRNLSWHEQSLIWDPIYGPPRWYLAGDPSGSLGELDQVKLSDLDNDGDEDVVFVQGGNLAWQDNPNADDVGVSWYGHNVTPSNFNVLDMAVGDLDGDGLPDLVAAGNDLLAGGVSWWKNHGGQVALETTSLAPTDVAVCQDGESPVLGTDAYHRGRMGDDSALLHTLAVRFENESGAPLTSEQLKEFVSEVSVFVGAPPSGALLTTASNLTLSDGVLQIPLPHSSPDVVLPAPISYHGDPPRNYYISLSTLPVKTSSSFSRFNVTLSLADGNSAKHYDTGLPLTLEYYPDVSTLVTIEQDAPPVIPSTTTIEVLLEEPLVRELVDVFIIDECDRNTVEVSLAKDRFLCSDMSNWSPGEAYSTESLLVTATDIAGNTSSQAITVLVLDRSLQCDTDGDGVHDSLDQCGDTPTGVGVDAAGCPVESDGDGIPDYLDQCPNTPAGVAVNENGCPVDSDGDGTPDYLDQCTNTPAGAAVNENGCPLDSEKPIADPGGPYLSPTDTPGIFDGSGSSDNHEPLEYSWDFGDGTVINGDEQQPHSYEAIGIYDVCLTVTDSHSLTDTECTSAVIYDPNGGFVTGGGWIESPPGAYKPDTLLSGRASFGFVSKYKKGATLPTGQTRFQFEMAGLSFHSDTYEWLVVAGAKAQYKGSGTIKGINGTFGFMLTAEDGDMNGSKNSDKFRIKIWDKDSDVGVIYDNKDGISDDLNIDNAQIIGGGSIVIHKSK